MNKKILITIGVMLIGVSAYSAIQDNFLAKWSTCSPYKSVFTNPMTKETFEKGVIGFARDDRNMTMHCLYYKQTAPKEFLVCTRKKELLYQGGPFERKQDCKMSSYTGLSQTFKRVEQRDYVINDVQTQIITQPMMDR